MFDSALIAEDPAELGIDPTKLAELTARARAEVDDGLLPSAQFAVARHGRIAHFETFGEATNETLYGIYSSTKAVTSTAGWLMIQEGKLDIAQRAAEIVPEFGANGKEAITVEQLFLHTAGFPSAPFRPVEWHDRARRLERFSSWRLNWEPGSRFEYHPTSSMYVIAEIVERLSGVPFLTFVKQRIFEPLGLADEFWLGLPEREGARVAEVAMAGEPPTPQDYRDRGLPVPPQTEVTPDALTSFNRPEVRGAGVPGGGGISSAAGIALFYQALLNGGRAAGGPEVWSQQTIDYGLTVRSGDHVDMMYGKPVNRALGLCVAGDADRNLRGFGHTNSKGAFGHGGAGGQIAWGDPATGISFGYCTNGHDQNPFRQGRRGVSLSTRAAALLA